MTHQRFHRANHVLNTDLRSDVLQGTPVQRITAKGQLVCSMYDIDRIRLSVMSRGTRERWLRMPRRLAADELPQ